MKQYISCYGYINFYINIVIIYENVNLRKFNLKNNNYGKGIKM